ncbi:uncharacterized protein Pyn_07310 [Prunus yedoensis var. nudiflora]|uniref:UBA domain-containing protein n=1 Tax=Prunus yedoensis var. nudiflora TaxID=2094558 RepID=A0A314XRI6_PRUYE|nr:uncharacterized protein Pyn_07310 [Prunus yedoensis var. nudiflora]
MSRKLEALAQQLVAMGFSLERATMAFILNEGRVEESVAGLFEGGEDTDKPRDQNFGGGNLKIDNLGLMGTKVTVTNTITVKGTNFLDKNQRL